MPVKEKLYTGLNNALLWMEYTPIAFLKKNWKWLVIIGLTIALLLSIKSCNEKNSKLADAQKAVHFNDSLSNSKIKYWIDKDKETHALVDNLFTDKFLTEAVLDSVTSLLNIKTKQVEQISKTTTKIQVDEETEVDSVISIMACPEGDSIKVVSRYDFRWTSKDSSTYVFGNVGAGADSIHVRATDTLSRVDYWKRRWFLGAKHYHSDFSNTNPYVKIVGYKGVKFDEKEKKWSVGPSVQIGYPLNQPIIFNKPAVSVGITLQYTIIRF